jgi:four helix bundle protein
MAAARHFTELEVWQLADEVRRCVGPVTERSGFNRHPKLRDQLSRAVESACPNIAEGFARFHPRDFAHFVRIARGSLAEAQDHLYRAATIGAITSVERIEFTAIAKRTCGAATKLILYLEAEAARRDSRRPRRKPNPEP